MLTDPRISEAARRDGFVLQLEGAVEVGKLVVRRERPTYGACNPEDLERYVAAFHAVEIDVYVVDLTGSSYGWRLCPGTSRDRGSLPMTILGSPGSE